MIRDKRNTYKRPLNEHELVAAAITLFHYKWFFKNVYYRAAYEADGLLITEAGYAVEIEAKTSIDDWRADFKKKKHGDQKFIKHLYYAVPEHLIEKAPDMPWEYGIITVYWDEHWGWRAKMHKRAADLKLGKFPPKILDKMFRGLYYKYWHQHYELLKAREYVHKKYMELRDARERISS